MPVQAYSDPERPPRQPTLNLAFKADINGELCSGDDAAQAEVFALDDLPSPLCSGHRKTLKDDQDSL